MAHLLVPLPLLAQAPKTKVLVLQAQSDDLDADARSAATTVVRDAVEQYPDVELLDTPTVDLLEVMIELECVDYDADCLSRMGEKWGADKVIFMQVPGKDGGFAPTFLLVDVKQGQIEKKVSATASDTAGLSGALSGLVTQAMGPAPVAEPPKPELVIVTINANETDAKVYLNDTYTGKTPLKVKLKPGSYRVRLVKEGFEDANDRITVTGEEDNTYSLEMASKAAAPVVTPPDTPPVVEEEDQPVYKQWWFWTVIGAAVVGGVVATAVTLSQEDDPAPTGALQFGFGTPDQDPLVRAAR